MKHDPRDRLRQVEMAIRMLRGAEDLHHTSAWSQFRKSMLEARQIHLEALAREDARVEYERGMIAAIELILAHQTPDPRRRQQLEMQAEGLREQIRSLHDADLLPPLGANSEAVT